MAPFAVHAKVLKQSCIVRVAPEAAIGQLKKEYTNLKKFYYLTGP
jgi:hypothetical protein